MKKNLPNLGLLLLAAAPALCLGKKQMLPPVHPQLEQVRNAYLVAKPLMNITPHIPDRPIDSAFLPKAENVSWAEVEAAKKAADRAEDACKRALDERDDAVAKQFPVYRPFLEMQRKLRAYEQEHAKELAMVFQSQIGMDKVNLAERQSSIAWGKYFNLSWAFRREHYAFPPFHLPEMQVSPIKIEKMAKAAPHFTCAPGTVLTDTTNPGLPLLYSGNGTFNPGKIVGYSLYKLSDELPATISMKTVDDGIHMPGHSSDTYHYQVAIDKKATSGSFCVLAHGMMGDVLVLFVVDISKKGMSPKQMNSHKSGHQKASSRK